jgi:hypothetical protein
VGYDVSIVRYHGDDVIDIAESEWLEYIKSDPELEPSEISHDSTYWEWNAHSKYQDPTEGRPWFHYGCGQIYSKNPDGEVLVKMFQIATCLKAKVQGQDGEFYDEGGRQMIDKTQLNKPVRSIAIRKPWWRFW